MTTTTKKPEPLSPYVLHSPAEVAAFKEATANYYAEIHAAEVAEKKAAEEKKFFESRALNDQEYFEIKQREEQTRIEKAEKREEAIKAKEKAEQEFLASTPDVVEIVENSEFIFLSKVVHFANKGYSLPPNGIQSFFQGFYHVTLNAPESVVITKDKK